MDFDNKTILVFLHTFIISQMASVSNQVGNVGFWVEKSFSVAVLVWVLFYNNKRQTEKDEFARKQLEAIEDNHQKELTAAHTNHQKELDRLHALISDLHKMLQQNGKEDKS